MSKFFDTEYQDFAICPHCGNEHRDAWEWDLGGGIEGEGEVNCEECDKEFSVSRMVEITYTTRKLKSKEGARNERHA
jgi:uncharacterized Zn-finger protein